MSGICLTKLDVLDGLDVINICTSYEVPEGECAGAYDAEYYEKKWYQNMKPYQVGALTIGVTNFDSLPMLKYISNASRRFVGCPVDIISTGPDRDDTIVLRDPLWRCLSECDLPMIASDKSWY